MSSGLPAVGLLCACFCVCVSLLSLVLFFGLFVAAVLLFLPPLCLLVGLCLVSSVAYPLPFCLLSRMVVCQLATVY